MEEAQRKEKEYIRYLSDFINDMMGRNELTTFEAAKKCGISRRKLCEITSHERKGMHFTTLIRISQSLNVSISELIGEAPADKKTKETSNRYKIKINY